VAHLYDSADEVKDWIWGALNRLDKKELKNDSTAKTQVNLYN